MARKISFNKDYILLKTKDFINEYGIEVMNVRALCKYIGCSTQPIFKNFENMNNLKKELKIYLHDYYDEFIYKIVDKEDYLFTISYAYALFSLKESNIFKALFMSDLAGSRTIKEVLNSSWNIDTINSIPKQYKLTKKQAEELYRDVRFFTHGLSCQIANRSIIVNEQEIKALIKNIITKMNKGGDKNERNY